MGYAGHGGNFPPVLAALPWLCRFMLPTAGTASVLLAALGRKTLASIILDQTL